MITRSRSRLVAPPGERRSPGRGRGTRTSSPAAAGPDARVRPLAAGNKRSGNTRSNNYWSSSTYADNPTNAWNVNFNDGNVNANNKTNNNAVRAVRGGS